MSLREIARFDDVYEAELAAAFLASHDIEASVTERFQTTVDPLMQRALGIRVMAPASQIDAARVLLSRVKAGEFAAEEGDDIARAGGADRAAGRLMALVAFPLGGFWGNSLPRRFRPIAWRGILLSIGGFWLLAGAIYVAGKLILDPP